MKLVAALVFLLALASLAFSSPGAAGCDCKSMCYKDAATGQLVCVCNGTYCSDNSLCYPQAVSGGIFGQRYFCYCTSSGASDAGCKCESGYDVGPQTGNRYAACGQKIDCDDTCCKLWDSLYPTGAANATPACPCLETCPVPVG